MAVQAALEEIRAGLPFRLLGVDSDNGSEFINWHLKRWCDREQIQLSRGRPYKKDDNAHIEQKNWTHVRKLLGWERYDSRAAVEAIQAVYRQELRLWMNLYQPSVKLVKKVRVGSKLRRVYSPAQTPFERMLAWGRGDSRRVAELNKLRSMLDPFELSRSIDRKLEGIYALANRRLSPKAITSRGATAVQRREVEKSKNRTFPPRLEIPQRTRDSHFHTATAAAGNGYIFNVSTAAPPVTFLNGLTRTAPHPGLPHHSPPSLTLPHRAMPQLALPHRINL